MIISGLTVLTTGSAESTAGNGRDHELYSRNGQCGLRNGSSFRAAGSLVAALPPVVPCSLLMQRHFIAGLTLGAVK